MKVVFFGTSHRSALFLEKAVHNGLKIDLVVSAPPKPVGRKQVLTENPVVTLAKQKDIPFTTKLPDLPATMKQCNNETIGLILDYHKIIPLKTINLFPKGIINIHYSKLPTYRGPAPVQTIILNGDKEAWISYFLITEEVDAGPILKQTSLPLDFNETTETLYQKLIAKSASEIVPLLNSYLSDKVRPHQQQGEPSYTTKLTMENCRIDWSKSSLEIERLIRAAYPEPGAWTMIEVQRSKGPEVQSENKCYVPLHHCTSAPKRLKILKAHVENKKLIPDIVQLEGKKPVSWKQFQEGYPEAEIKQN